MTANRRNKRPYRKQAERHIYVRGERRDPPDTHRLSKALLARAMEMAQAEADAASAATRTRSGEAGHAAEGSEVRDADD